MEAPDGFVAVAIVTTRLDPGLRRDDVELQDDCHDLPVTPAKAGVQTRLGNL